MKLQQNGKATKSPFQRQVHLLHCLSTMKFSKTLITAFVGSSTTESNPCAGPLCLLPATGPVTEPPPTSTSVTRESQSGVVVSRCNVEQSTYSPLAEGVREWLVPSALAAEAGRPTQEEIKLLQEAFSAFYGVDRDLVKSEQLLSKVVEAWQRQPAGMSKNGSLRHPHTPCRTTDTFCIQMRKLASTEFAVTATWYDRPPKAREVESLRIHLITPHSIFRHCCSQRTPRRIILLQCPCFRDQVENRLMKPSCQLRCKSVPIHLCQLPVQCNQQDLRKALTLFEYTNNEIFWMPYIYPLKLCYICRLGRARAIRSQGKQASADQLSKAAKDYQLSLRLSSREDWDTDAENEEDGASRNPYAAWEWGSTLRSSGDLAGAVTVHKLAAESFDDIGDKTRSIMSQMDEGIDLAAMGKNADAKETITGAIKR